MLIYFGLLWLIIYLISICASFIKLLEIVDALKVLVAYLDSAIVEESRYDIVGSHLIKKEVYNECLSNALYKFPLIQKYSGYYCDSLEYGASDIKNYSTAIKLYNVLLMKRNYIIQAFKESLNPLRSLKTLFSLPGLLLSWFGLPQKISFSRLLNLLCWIAAYLLGLYGEEIKVFLSLVIKNFV